MIQSYTLTGVHGLFLPDFFLDVTDLLSTAIDRFVKLFTEHVTQVRRLAANPYYIKTQPNLTQK
jgi:hypothetical protein